MEITLILVVLGLIIISGLFSSAELALALRAGRFGIVGIAATLGYLAVIAIIGGPVVPFISRCGIFEGSTVGSVLLPS